MTLPLVVIRWSDFNTLGLLWVLLYAGSGVWFQLLQAEAFSRYDASSLAPFIYTSFIWTVLFDILIWSAYTNLAVDLGGEEVAKA